MEAESVDRRVDHGHRLGTGSRLVSANRGAAVGSRTTRTIGVKYPGSTLTAYWRVYRLGPHARFWSLSKRTARVSREAIETLIVMSPQDPAALFPMLENEVRFQQDRRQGWSEELGISSARRVRGIGGGRRGRGGFWIGRGGWLRRTSGRSWFGGLRIGLGRTLPRASRSGGGGGGR